MKIMLGYCGGGRMWTGWGKGNGYIHTNIYPGPQRYFRAAGENTGTPGMTEKVWPFFVGEKIGHKKCIHALPLRD